ncbi:ankyrin repeat domain-containing protein [Skeletonema marinoi]|uniref:Ankyrin repeat domain-containing protein n=1 Tax=Skeletonema marinoi TaxID=267567 RepID=A0AAD8YG81_9STRA|nr:ankyrin repeat domain-containing protein [Skeletonema marinoi]
MQQLNIGQNANIQSNPSSLPELRAYCQSDSISLDRLRSIFINIFFLYYLGHPLDCTTYDYDILLVDICKNEHVTYEIVQCVIEHVPGAASVVTTRGFTPLHFLCMNKNVTQEIVRCVIGGNSDALLAQDEFGMTPLMILCHNRAVDETVAEEILTLFLETFPIHSAIGALTGNPQAAVEVVKFLLTFAPSVVSQELNGMTNAYPLIYACFEIKASNLSSGLEVIKLLYNAYPQAIVNAEEIFRLGIDISNFVDAVRDFINEQLRYATQASNLQLVRTQDGNGRLPLHHALEEDAPLGTIKLLVQADPATLQIPDSDGSLPLHIAASEYECPNVIKYLLDNCRTSLLVAKDCWGNTPLHYACQEGRYDVIEMLLTQYPNAPVATRNVDGDLPIQLLLDFDDHIYEESADYASCIFLLLKASPEMWMSNENLVLALTS